MTNPTKVCPRDPTPEMANAGLEYSGLPGSTWRAMYDAAPTEAAQGEVEAALRLLMSYGCPVCQGDCAGANPPVITCPMSEAARALAPKAAQDISEMMEPEPMPIHGKATLIASPSPVPKAAQDKCDGNHGGPPCADPECWNQ